MLGILNTKLFWGLLCLVLCSTLSFQMGQQSAIARNNASSAQFEMFLGQLDAATRQRLSETPTEISPDGTTASINENSR